MPYQWKPYLNKHELRWQDRFLDLWMNGQKYRDHLKRTIDLYLSKKEYYHEKSRENLINWQKIIPFPGDQVISLSPEDCLVAARELTQFTGVQPTIVNFANAENVLGVARYRVGSQEEAIARQTNLSATIKDEEVKDGFHYTAKMSEHIKASYFNPEELLMITEDDGTPTSEDQIFSFRELRCAADDLRVKIFGIPLPFLSYRYNDESMRNKIRAQLDTLVAHQRTHVILGAFGCGAFKNPPEKIAQIYQELLAESKYLNHFKKIVFAIKGDGEDRNFKAFKAIFFPPNSVENLVGLITNSGYWETKVKQFPGLHMRLPTGIKAMQDYVSLNKEKPQAEQLEGLKKIAQARLSSNPRGFFSQRAPETIGFYQAILRLSAK